MSTESHSELDTVLCTVIKDIAKTCRYLSALASNDRPQVAKRLEKAAVGFEDIYNEAVKRGQQ